VDPVILGVIEDYTALFAEQLPVAIGAVGAAALGFLGMKVGISYALKWFKKLAGGVK